MTKRFLCVALMLILAIPVFAAAEEPITITAVLQINPEVIIEDNPVVQYIEENLGSV